MKKKKKNAFQFQMKIYTIENNSTKTNRGKNVFSLKITYVGLFWVREEDREDLFRRPKSKGKKGRMRMKRMRKRFRNLSKPIKLVDFGYSGLDHRDVYLGFRTIRTEVRNEWNLRGTRSSHRVVFLNPGWIVTSTFCPPSEMALF